ncbi:MAG TPA: hypothetical protein VF607_14980 [Verrucomicrobiae bacterium]
MKAPARALIDLPAARPSAPYGYPAPGPVIHQRQRAHLSRQHPLPVLPPPPGKPAKTVVEYELPSFRIEGTITQYV